MIIFGKSYYKNEQKYFHLNYYDITNFDSSDLSELKFIKNRAQIIKIDDKIHRLYKLRDRPHINFYAPARIAYLSKFQRAQFEEISFGNIKNLPRSAKYVIFLNPTRKNYFVSINTMYSKLIFKSSAGIGQQSGPEKSTIAAIQRVSYKLVRFLLKNRITRAFVALTVKIDTFTSQVLKILKKFKSSIKIIYFKVIKYQHSKGLRLKKLKRL